MRAGCCKEDPVDVVFSCHISDEQVALWHEEWKTEGEKQQDTLKRAFDNVGEELHKSNRFRTYEPEMYYRALKEAGYDHQIEQKKNIHPAHMASSIVTYMWANSTGDTSRDADYKGWILDHK